MLLADDGCHVDLCVTNRDGPRLATAGGSDLRRVRRGWYNHELSLRPLHPTMILLNVNDVRKHFGPEPVLDGVSFDLRVGDKLALVGPNGAGKTTLLRILTGKEEPDAGSLELRASAKLGFLEQQPDFAPGRTVWEEASAALGELRQMVHEAERLACD